MRAYIFGIIIIILNLIDALYTKFVVELGVCREVNPVMVYLIDNYGMNWAMIIKMIVICFVVYRLVTSFESKLARIGVYLITGLYTLLSLYHLYTFILLKNGGLL
jgi:hypothetical protein